MATSAIFSARISRLDATINPDFGEVEVDPAVVNLSAFETFYPEKRPFFVSGAGAFDFGRFNCYFCSNVESMTLFYSRRIGRYPELGNYFNDVAASTNIPTNTNILGAAKITGRTQNGYTVGVLDAVTSEESGSYIMASDSAPHTVPMEPLSNYFVARVKRDLRQGATTFGGMITSTTRNLASGLLTDSLHHDAEAAGGDFITTWANRHYSLMGNVAVSEVGGTPESILLTEESSAHYFQRPDRHTIGGGLFGDRLDSTATSLRGYGGYLRLGKDNGNWLWETATNIRSPGFEVNDLSYMQRADYIWNDANLARQWTVPGTWYRSIFTVAGGQIQHNYDGDRTGLQGHAFLNVQFRNYWNAFGYYLYRPTVMDDELTRGGPVVKRNGEQDAAVGVNTDARRSVVLSAFLEGNVGLNEPSQELTPRLTALFKPTSSISVHLRAVTRPQPVEPAIRHGRRRARVRALLRHAVHLLQHRPGHAVTRYAHLRWRSHRRSPSMCTRSPSSRAATTTRSSSSTIRDSSIKSVYGVDVGSISEDDGEYCIDPTGPAGSVRPVCSGPGATPGAFAILNPDFNTRSLRGNAVLRWEYRPGSTIYFVWEQTRYDDNLYGPVGNFALGRDEGYLARAPADDIFLIKLDWWVGR